MRAGCVGLKHRERSEGRNFSVSVETWALTIPQKISKFSKQGQMVQKIPGKGSRKYRIIEFLVEW